VDDTRAIVQAALAQLRTHLRRFMHQAGA
jgi:hypothetical protein